MKVDKIETSKVISIHRKIQYMPQKSSGIESDRFNYMFSKQEISSFQFVGELFHGKVIWLSHLPSTN